LRVFNATGRLVANPLFAVVICLGGGFALWFSLARTPSGAPTANLGGKPGTGKRTITKSRSDAIKRVSPAAISTNGTRTKPSAVDAQTTASDPRHERIEEFEAENEPPNTATTATAADRLERRPKATEGDLPTASTADAISPLDPRANALLEYQTKKAALPETAAANKEIAQWCDQHGLWDGAKIHWEAVLRLDSKSEEARKRLGFRLRNRAWVFDAASAEDVAQKKANAYWKVLEKLHAQMRCKSKLAVPGRAEAVAHIEAVGDSRAAAAIWNTFAKDVSHHSLMVGILRRFKTAEASRMLAALAVYSRDDKAQAAAVAALRGRGSAEFGEKLVALMHTPMRVEERQVPMLGRAPARELFVEGETHNYQFLFSRADAPTSDSLAGCFQPRLSAGEIEMARRFNENQAAMAREALDEQVDLAKAMIQKYNDSIRDLNRRVANVLSEACGARVMPDPESGRRWLASTLGTAYRPAADGPKPTITDIVSPLYNPTFLPIPVAT
jgi:hypothetical protein